MLSQKLEDAINRQINAEISSAYLYLSMSAYFEASNLDGFARWMREQHREETEHALKFFDFLVDREARVVLHPIAQPPVEFDSTQAVMQQTLEHERQVTAAIHRLYSQAVKENDYPLQVMLHWFIDEQVEEEKVASQIVEQLKLLGDDRAGLLLLDARLGARGGSGAKEA